MTQSVNESQSCLYIVHCKCLPSHSNFTRSDRISKHRVYRNRLFHPLLPNWSSFSRFNILWACPSVHPDLAATKGLVWSFGEHCKNGLNYVFSYLLEYIKLLWYKKNTKVIGASLPDLDFDDFLKFDKISVLVTFQFWWHLIF